MKFGLFLAGSVAALAIAGVASAQVITDASGSYAVGVGVDGELYDFASGTGFVRLGDGFDPLRPGTPRDSWSIATAANAAWADQSFFGSQGLTSVVLTGANSANVSSTSNIGFDVNQTYSFVGGGNILRVDAVVTNVSSGGLEALFARNVDWDVAPTELGENTVGAFGTNPFVVGSSALGFEDPAANAPYTLSCLGGCNLDGDLGAGIQINLGFLGAGDSARFSYFYGVNVAGDDLDALVGQAQLAGATYLIGTQSSEAGLYPGLGLNSAVLGVGDVTITTTAVPEPATWAMMLAGFFGMGSMVRRKRAVA